MSASTWFGIVLAGVVILSVVSCEMLKGGDLFDDSKDNGNDKHKWYLYIFNSYIFHRTDLTAAKRPSFFVGSRYGRSQYPQTVRNLNIVPRNDRFFLGSRYGKRSDEYMQDNVDPEPSHDTRQQRPITGSMMTCMYTGVKEFYRCYNV